MKPKTKTINLMLLDGGLGDHIASLVAVDYVLKQYPWITPIIWMPDFLTEFAINALPPKTNVKGFSQMRGVYDPTKPTKTTKWDGHTSPMKIHCVDYAFLKLCDENPDIEYKNYLRPRELVRGPEEKYVVFTTGFTADVREWLPSEINKTAKYVKDKGYNPVFLGQTLVKTGIAHNIQGNFKEEIDFSVGLNLIDKTTLSEAASIMEDSAAVLGVDNGLIHLAGCTNAPIVGGFTTVKPEIRMPIRNNRLGYEFYPIVPDKTLDCSFCQQKTNFLYGHDYRNCLFKDDAARKNACVKQMTADKFIAHLETILK